VYDVLLGDAQQWCCAAAAAIYYSCCEYLALSTVLKFEIVAYLL
jgi:hypothetical protein